MIQIDNDDPTLQAYKKALYGDPKDLVLSRKV